MQKTDVLLQFDLFAAASARFVCIDPDNEANIVYRSGPILLSATGETREVLQLPAASRDLVVQPVLELQCGDWRATVQLQDVSGVSQRLETPFGELGCSVTRSESPLVERQSYVQITHALLQRQPPGVFALEMDSGYSVQSELLADGSLGGALSV